MKNIHFIAIGGAIMHQLALALHRQGNKITGSDDEINDPAKQNLLHAGLLPATNGWHPERITTGLDAVVLGMHAKGDNPELLRAKELNIPVLSFPEYIFEVSKNKKRIVIAGSHGKTTITSMVMHMLQKNLPDFDYLVGAKVKGFEQSVKLSDAPIIVLEGDEYPASAEERKPKILFYHPHISVLSGIAWDHINVFPTYENYCSQFTQYLREMEAGSLLFYNGEDAEVARLVAESGSHLKATPYYVPEFRYDDGNALVKMDDGTEKQLAVFGRHNLLNMQVAIAVCMALGIEKEACYNAIADFGGAAKRLEKIFENEQIVAFRDFAHAPSKLQATLDAVREIYPEHKLIACFELHTYSSLNETFLKQYKDSMKSADEAFVFYSNHALELKRLPQLESETVKQFFGAGNLQVFNKKNDLENAVRKAVSGAGEKVCLLLMSSGTFEGIDWNTVSSRP